jgi:hypothetical protein
MLDHSPRSTHHRRWLVRAGLAALALDACSPAPATKEEAEMQALLDDGRLDNVIQQAQTIMTGGSGGSTPDDGGVAGSGGSMGMGGFGGTGSNCTGGAGGIDTGGSGGVGGKGGFGGSGGFVTDAAVAAPARGDAAASVDVSPSTGDAGAPDDAGGGNCFFGPLARWELDDCNPERTELFDSMGGFTAFRSVNAQCVPGAEGQGVSLPNPKDIVYVPDQPVFTFANGVTIAAWVNPGALTGTQTIFRKREGTATSSVALMLVKGQYVFVIDRAGGTPAQITAPAKAGWTHVAATYDGMNLNLYIDGKPVTPVAKPGTIQGGEGPLLFGNDANQRRFLGTVDKLFFDTKPAPADVIAAQLCLHGKPTLTATPMMSMAVNPGTPVQFDLALTNNNRPQCAPEDFSVINEDFSGQFAIDPQFQDTLVASGQTTHLPVMITANDDVAEGTFPLTFMANGNSFFDPARQVSATINYVVTLAGCRVQTSRELMIRDLSVVEDPIRTTFTAAATDKRRGVWTFKHLIEQIAPTPAQAPEVAEAIFKSFLVTQKVNGFSIAPRPDFKPVILDPWPRVGGKLDLTKAPLRLLAIVNRIDLRDISKGHAGEARFVFGMLDSGGNPLEATMILEYHLPATTTADVLTRANAWHALGGKTFPSEDYNVALQALTEEFVKRRTTGSLLAQLRTNEIALGAGAEWQLREFNLDATGKLVPATIKLTPDQSFNGSTMLADFVNMNETAILAERHTVPLKFEGAPFLGGAVFNDLGSWFADGIKNPEARHKFAANTCNGCHSATETNTFFLQIAGRFPGETAQLSPFLMGTSVQDPVTGERRFLNDLARRNADLKSLVCPAMPGVAQPASAAGTSVGLGIGRVE